MGDAIELRQDSQSLRKLYAAESTSQLHWVKPESLIKLHDLRAAGFDTTDLPISHADISTVGQFLELIQSCKKVPGLLQKLGNVLDLSAMEWKLVQMQVEGADSSVMCMHVWLHPPEQSGLLFPYNEEKSELDDPLAVLRYKLSKKTNDGKITAEVQMDPDHNLRMRPAKDDKKLSELVSAALRDWFYPGRPGWTIWPDNIDAFDRLLRDNKPPIRLTMPAPKLTSDFRYEGPSNTVLKVGHACLNVAAERRLDANRSQPSWPAEASSSQEGLKKISSSDLSKYMKEATAIDAQEDRAQHKGQAQGLEHSVTSITSKPLNSSDLKKTLQAASMGAAAVSAPDLAGAATAGPMGKDVAEHANTWDARILLDAVELEKLLAHHDLEALQAPSTWWCSLSLRNQSCVLDNFEKLLFAKLPHDVEDELISFVHLPTLTDLTRSIPTNMGQSGSRPIANTGSAGNSGQSQSSSTNATNGGPTPPPPNGTAGTAGAAGSLGARIAMGQQRDINRAIACGQDCKVLRVDVEIPPNANSFIEKKASNDGSEVTLTFNDNDGNRCRVSLEFCQQDCGPERCFKVTRISASLAKKQKSLLEKLKFRTHATPYLTHVTIGFDPVAGEHYRNPNSFFDLGGQAPDPEQPRILESEKLKNNIIVTSTEVDTDTHWGGLLKLSLDGVEITTPTFDRATRHRPITLVPRGTTVVSKQLKRDGGPHDTAGLKVWLDLTAKLALGDWSTETELAFHASLSLGNHPAKYIMHLKKDANKQQFHPAKIRCAMGLGYVLVGTKSDLKELLEYNLVTKATLAAHPEYFPKEQDDCPMLIVE